MMSKYILPWLPCGNCSRHQYHSVYGCPANMPQSHAVFLSDIRTVTSLIRFQLKPLRSCWQRLTASYEISQKCLTKNCMHQSHQLIRSLHSCTTSAGYEVSEAQKAVLLLPRTEKSSSTSSEEHCALQAFPAHYDELREH
jgi:hypothetical protein